MVARDKALNAQMACERCLIDQKIAGIRLLQIIENSKPEFENNTELADEKERRRSHELLKFIHFRGSHPF